MLKFQKGTRKVIWKNDRFLRLSGVMDALLRKVSLQEGNDGLKIICSARIERIQREFVAFEAACQQQLIPQVAAMQTTISGDLSTYRALGVSITQLKEVQPAPKEEAEVTSADLKQMEQRREQERQLAEKQAAAAASLAEASCRLDELLSLYDRQVDQALADANAGVARYCKATQFRVVDREIPSIRRHTWAKDTANAQLRHKVEEVL